MTSQKNRNKPSGVILYAKPSGITSFSSLWSIKHALNTDKVGHTGTLDSFAEGLLVVLSGNLTHLVPHITSFTKTYLAVVCFGKETDTLDPTGNIIRTGSAVSKDKIESVLKKFTGAILQIPPVYSAVHVDGKRASDMARNGKDVRLESRQVFVYKNELKDFKEPSENDECSYALLEIVCSKGTYIRALARDIAESVGTCAFLCALRRTKVGPFELKDSACADELKDFTIENGIQNMLFFRKEKEKIHFPFDNKRKNIGKDSPEKVNSIRDHFLLFTPQLASLCGFDCDELKSEFKKSYLNGRPLSPKMFNILSRGNSEHEIAVFYNEVDFAGMICKNKDSRLSYGFVVPPEKKEFKVFSWSDLYDGKFPVEWKAKGSSVTVGNFDAVHAGHIELIKTVIAQKNLVPGIITFSSSIKNSDSENIFTLDQRLDFFNKAGLSFAVVIDFTPEFSHIGGAEFLETLVSFCGMRFLAEGRDFKCGYKGSFDMDSISAIASEKKFVLCRKDDIFFENFKISSTRIRNEIIAGDFSNVQKMILRPYSCDLRGLKWKEKSIGKETSCFEAVSDKKQLLPKNGIYKVSAVDNDGNIFHTMLCIDNGKFEIDLPSMRFAEKTVEVMFC